MDVYASLSGLSRSLQIITWALQALKHVAQISTRSPAIVPVQVADRRTCFVIVEFPCSCQDGAEIVRSLSGVISFLCFWGNLILVGKCRILIVKVTICCWFILIHHYGHGGNAPGFGRENKVTCNCPFCDEQICLMF